MTTETPVASPTIKPPYRIAFGHIEIGASGRRWLHDALSRNWVSEGPNVARFEAGFAKRFGYGHAIATSSGTDAGIVVMSSLLNRGARRGDEVLTPALAFASTANCILAAGLIPKFVDVELETLNLNPALLEAAISPRTRAIQVVHTMGKPCKMDQVLEVARRRHLVVIEDCCEAHGATLHGQVVGSFGIAGLFSFYAAHLICSGEGGMIAAADQSLAAVCRSIRSHGYPDGQSHVQFQFDRVGYNSKMNDLEAAIGLEGLELFDQTFSARRRHLLRLWDLLRSVEDHLMLYRDGPSEVTSPHALPLVLRDERQTMDGLYEHLERSGIQCKTLFGSLPTQHRAFSFLGYQLGAFPVAERIGRTGLHFGVHQYLTPDDIEYAAERIRAYFA